VDRVESCTTTIQESNQKTLEIRILSFHQLIGRAFEIYFAGAKNEETGWGNAGGFGRGITANFFGLRIEMKIGEGEAVLEAMSGEQGGDTVNIAKAEDEADDGLRGDGVEARGGRVIQNDGRMGDEGASDGDATTHTAREFGRKHVAGVAEFDEAEDFFHAGLDFLFVNVIFVKAVGDIFADGEGVEQSAFLEDETDLAARSEQLGFGQAGDVFAENADAAGIGAQESGSKFEQKSFPCAGLAEKDYGFTFLSGESDTAKNFTFLEAEADIIEFDGRLSGFRES
jgi:hypothetical protein